VKAIKALLVEDNDGDVRLMKEALAEAGGTHVELSHVYRLKDALGTALAQSGPDLVEQSRFNCIPMKRVIP
jgi:hypothetical protein